MNQAVVKEVRSVLIPLHQSQLLLPNAVTAEVMGYQQPEPMEGDVPEWFLGNLAWRGVMVPVISFEGMIGDRVVMPGYRGRIMVMNTIGGQERLSHIGLVVQALPSLVRVNADNVEPVDHTDEQSPLIKQNVQLEMSPAIIPDLDELERQVLDIISQQ